MHRRNPIAAIGLLLTLSGAQAFDDAKYPDWKGQWIGGWTQRFPGVTGQPSYDPHKSAGEGQQAPLTPEYQAIFAASLADQAAGGTGNDPQVACLPSGMPRMMIAYYPMEIVITPDTTHLLIQTIVKERIYQDKADPNVLYDEITTIDHALTRPWTTTKNYRRNEVSQPVWLEFVCAESNPWLTVGKDTYYLSGDGYLVPTRKDQSPPDTRYFSQPRK
jgi:hypothetical protein